MTFGGPFQPGPFLAFRECCSSLMCLLLPASPSAVFRLSEAPAQPVGALPGTASHSRHLAAEAGPDERLAAAGSPRRGKAGGGSQTKALCARRRQWRAGRGRWRYCPSAPRGRPGVRRPGSVPVSAAPSPEVVPCLSPLRAVLCGLGPGGEERVGSGVC